MKTDNKNKLFKRLFYSITLLKTYMFWYSLRKISLSVIIDNRWKLNIKNVKTSLFLKKQKRKKYLKI